MRRLRPLATKAQGGGSVDWGWEDLEPLFVALTLLGYIFKLSDEIATSIFWGAHGKLTCPSGGVPSSAFSWGARGRR